MKLAFLGDVYLGNATAAPKVDQTVAAVLGDCDYVIANLEAPITEVDAPRRKSGVRFKQTAQALELLADLNCRMVSLANNHIADHGRAGLGDTIARLRERGFGHAGAALQIADAYRPMRIFDDNLTVSVVCGAENGFGCFSFDDDGEGGYAWLFHPAFWRMVSQEVAECDYVIAVVHGGVEYMDRPLPQWRRVYRELVDSGVHAVIAHHPHLTQGIETYNNAPIFYSIGNFYFNKDSRHAYWYHGQVPVLSIDSASGIGVEVQHTQFTVGDGGTVGIDETSWGEDRTKRLSQELASPEYQTGLEADLIRMWKLRYRFGLERAFTAFVSSTSCMRLAKHAVRAALGRVTWRDPALVEALVDIESHRWAVAETMRLKAGKKNQSALPYP